MKSKASIRVSRIFAWVRVFLGITFTVMIMMTLSATQSLVDEAGNTLMDLSTRTALIYLAYAGIIVMISGILTIRRTTRFRRYVSIIFQMNITSITDIAQQMSRKHKYIAKDLAKMIRKRYFTNAYLDLMADRIVIRNFVRQTAYTEGPGTGSGANAALNAAPVQNSAPAAPAQPGPVKCSGCGAVNTVLAGQSMQCEYCGALIK